MSFRVCPLPAAQFEPLFGLDEAALAARGVIAQTVDVRPGFPCRVSLCDADLGARALLLNFEHQPARTAYRAAHAIFVVDGAREAQPEIGEVPEAMASRLLSVRAFSGDGMMLDADVVDGREAAGLFRRLLALEDAAYLHAHYARRGCFAARVERA